jgi:putative peptide zinc metalloprotease protein
VSSALFSGSWYRVAGLMPRLRAQAEITRHTYRNEIWYVMQDLASGRFLRFNPPAYQVIALMDGQRTLSEIWELVLGNHGDAAPTQDEVLHLLAQLHQANVLLTDRRPDLDELHHRQQHSRRMKLKQYFSNPLALKLPLFDPDRLLGVMVGWLPKGSGYVLFILWLAIFISGIFMAATHWDELTRDVTSRIFTPNNMLLLWLAFPLVKAIHELGHGLMIKAFGGQCHEMGLMFLVLVPIPYVDASQTVALQRRYQRVLISLAGIMIELMVASIALWFWSGASVGPAKAFFYQIIILAGVTTVVFNANPLLRFDGYYVLADWLEIPNLATKANSYIAYLINRYLFGVIQGNERPRMTANEPAWLLVFGVLSFLYRMFVMFAILILVGSQFFLIGMVLAVVGFYLMALKPLSKIVHFLFRGQMLEGYRQRAVMVSGGILAACLLLLGLVPVSSWTSTEGVIWMAEQSQVRAPVPCFAKAVLVAPGTQVHAGQPLLSCTDLELAAEHLRLQARQDELNARLVAAVVMDRVAVQIIDSELKHSTEQLADISAKIEAMQIVSPHDGTFVMSTPQDFAGNYLKRGTVLGYVLDPARFTLLSVVPQSEVDLVRRNTQRVELRMVGRVHDLILAHIIREVPGATTNLPSLALSLAGGGGIGLDPDASAQAPQSISSLFQFELEFDKTEVPALLGMRVYVRFVHRPESLLNQWYRSLRQVFIKYFAV